MMGESRIFACFWGPTVQGFEELSTLFCEGGGRGGGLGFLGGLKRGF